MKLFFFVFSGERNGKKYSEPVTIKSGENLIPFIERYNAAIVHLCKTREEAERIALEWNKTN